MQLTPRHLALASAALIAGGAVFGIVTTLAPSLTVAPATAATPSATELEAVPTEVGDEAITFPSTSPAPVPPSPASSAPVPSPTPRATAASSPAVDAPLPTPTTSTRSSSPSPRAHTRATPRSTPRATSRPRSSAAPRPAAPSPAPGRPVTRHVARHTSVVGNWSAPTLHAGANTIRLPQLNSGARVRVTVGCSPSSACQVSADQLVIDPAAASVTVTWWATARGGYPSWEVSRGL